MPTFQATIKIPTAHAGGHVTVKARIEPALSETATLAIVVRDTGAGASSDELRRGRETGVGLNNVARRLACQYGSAGSVSDTSIPGAGTTVEIRLPVEDKATVELGASRSAS